MGDAAGAPDVFALRPFVPAKDLAVSQRFYGALGFGVERLDDTVASVRLGPFGFLLQAFDVPEFAGNFMMQLMVRDLDAWWARIAALDLAAAFGVRAPAAPQMQPWGLRVAFVVDPSGVLWHVAQVRG